MGFAPLAVEADLERAAPVIAPVRARPGLTKAVLVIVDFLAFCLSVIAAFALQPQAAEDPNVLMQAWIVPASLLIAYLSVGLYPAVAMSPSEQLRRGTLASLAVYLLLIPFFVQVDHSYPPLAFLLAIAFAIVGVPVARGLTKALLAKRSWWGFPVVIIGDAVGAEAVVASLANHPNADLKPIAILDENARSHGNVRGVPVVGRSAMNRILDGDDRVPYAILPAPAAPRDDFNALIENYGKIFRHLIIIPEAFGPSTMWLSPRDLGGVLGLEVRQRLLLPGPRRIKRMIDVALTMAAAVIVLPIVALIAIAIRCDSNGPIFFGQWRIGQGGRRFKAWKFRTMVANAEAVLDDHLAKHPELLESWDRDRKLKDDPRLTRIGRLLRRTSLDELPQLLNVFKGEMSLVGPRPIVQEEIERYGDHFYLYGRSKPGMTGLWQVSGRNDTTYAQRVEFDCYYIRNWSTWMDLWIMARTVWVVLIGKGAY